MGRKSTVDKLPDKQFDFVIQQILDGKTDREISSEFQKKFKKELAKSSLNTWRNKAGNELAERYRLKRFQARSFVETLKSEGIEIDDKYTNIIESLEDHLLTSERELIAQNPTRLLLARQREENFRLKREQIALKREEMAFEREKFERTQNLQSDKFKIASESWKYILAFFTNLNSPVADDLTRHSPELIKGLGEYIEQI